MIVLVIKEGTDKFKFGDVSKPKFDINMLANIPTLFVSYAFQSAFFPVFSSLEHKTKANGIKATAMSFTF